MVPAIDIAGFGTTAGRNPKKDLVMKILNVVVAGGTLLLIAALPAIGQPISPRAGGAPVHLVAEQDFGAKKDEYVRRMKDEMRDWQKKIHDFGERAEDKGHEASDATKAGLRDAWAKTETESRRLESAGAEGWESAKSAFETASNNMKGAWRKIHPEDE